MSQTKIDELLKQANSLLAEAGRLADLHNIKFEWCTPDGDHSFTYVPTPLSVEDAAKMLEGGEPIDAETRKKIATILRNGGFVESYEESYYGRGWVSSSAMC